MEAKREKLLLKQYSLQLKEEKSRQKEVNWSSNPALCAVHDIVILHLFFLFPVSLGEEEKERRKPEA